jgi:hypothetical protein
VLFAQQSKIFAFIAARSPRIATIASRNGHIAWSASKDDRVGEARLASRSVNNIRRADAVTERKLMRSAKVWAYRELSGKKYFEVLLEDGTTGRIDFLEGSTTPQSFLALAGALELNLGGCRIIPMNKLALFDDSDGLPEDAKRKLSKILYNPLNSTEPLKQFTCRPAESHPAETPELPHPTLAFVGNAVATQPDREPEFAEVRRSEDMVGVKAADRMHRTNAWITPVVKAPLREIARLMLDIGGPSAVPLKAAVASGAIKILNGVSTVGTAASRAARKAPIAWATQI